MRFRRGLLVQIRDFNLRCTAGGQGPPAVLLLASRLEDERDRLGFVGANGDGLG